MPISTYSTSTLQKPIHLRIQGLSSINIIELLVSATIRGFLVTPMNVPLIGIATLARRGLPANNQIHIPSTSSLHVISINLTPRMMIILPTILSTSLNVTVLTSFRILRIPIISTITLPTILSTSLNVTVLISFRILRVPIVSTHILESNRFSTMTAMTPKILRWTTQI